MPEIYTLDREQMDAILLLDHAAVKEDLYGFGLGYTQVYAFQALADDLTRLYRENGWPMPESGPRDEESTDTEWWTEADTQQENDAGTDPYEIG